MKKILQYTFLPILLIFSITSSFANEPPPVFNWETFQVDAAHTGYVPIEVNPSALALAWEKNLNTDPAYPLTMHDANSFIATDEQLVLGTIKFSLGLILIHSINSKTGEEEWNKTFKSSFIGSSLSYHKGKFFAYTGYAGENTLLSVFNLRDQELTYSLPIPLASSASVIPYSDAIYSSNGDKVYSFNDETGMFNWFYTVNNFNGLISAMPAVNEKYVIVAARNELYVINRLTGKDEFKIAIPQYTDSFPCFNTSPVISNANHIVLNNIDSHLTAFDLEKKEVIWSLDDQTRIQPSVDQSEVIVVKNYNRNNHLVALDIQTGKELWTFTPPLRESFRYFPLITKSLIFISSDNKTYAISRATHELVWEYPEGGQLIMNEHMLYIVDKGIKISAIKLN